MASEVTVDKIARVVNKATKKLGLTGATKKPGFSVLVKHQGKEIFKNSVGYAEIHKGTKITNESLFDLASVAKQFTVVGIMLLQEKSLLSVKDLVSTYLKEFTIPNVTIQHLIWHTSGISDYTEELDDEELESMTMEEHLIWIIGQPYKTPGKKHKYNNSGYVLLALIIERVSGQKFPDYFEEHVFGPLGMSSTTCIEPCNKVKGYERKHKRYVECHWPTKVFGDGNIFSNLSDLSKWDDALRECKLISKESWDWMCTPGERTKDYGGGLEIGEDCVLHSGSWAACLSFFVISWNPCVTVICLCNSGHIESTLENLVDNILDLFE